MYPSQTQFGFTKLGSKMLIFRVISPWKGIWCISWYSYLWILADIHTYNHLHRLCMLRYFGTDWTCIHSHWFHKFSLKNDKKNIEKKKLVYEAHLRRSIRTSTKLFKKSVTKEKCRAQSQILIIMYFIFIPSRNGNKSVAHWSCTK